MLGNAAPSSVADCLGNSEKFAAYLEGTKVRLEVIWKADEHFKEVDWRDLGNAEFKFIRVVGDATADEAAEVISVISKFRQKSEAFVVTNAVKIDGVETLDELSEASIEGIKAFDVLGAIMAELTEQEQVVVKCLIDA